MWVGDGVVVVVMGCEGKRKGETQNMFFSGVYTVYGIRLLFQGHCACHAELTGSELSWVH